MNNWKDMLIFFFLNSLWHPFIIKNSLYFFMYQKYLKAKYLNNSELAYAFNNITQINEIPIPIKTKQPHILLVSVCKVHQHIRRQNVEHNQHYYIHLN